MLIAGMGELHLDIIRDCLFREFSVDATGRPQIAYRETITSETMSEGKFIRQSGGRGHSGDAVIKLELVKRSEGTSVENEIVGGVIPKEYMKPKQEGILEGANNGVVAGSPVVDFCARIVDSSEMGFRMAGIFGFKDAIKKAGPMLLESIMKVEVSTPEEYQGDVIGDLNRHRGQIQSMEREGKAGEYHSLCTIGENVWLCDGCGFADKGTGQLFDGAFPFRASSGEFVATDDEEAKP
jgi:elongation factor G